MKNPLPSVTAIRRTLPSPIAVTVTPGSTAPLSSITRPTSCPVRPHCSGRPSSYAGCGTVSASNAGAIRRREGIDQTRRKHVAGQWLRREAIGKEQLPFEDRHRQIDLRQRHLCIAVFGKWLPFVSPRTKRCKDRSAETRPASAVRACHLFRGRASSAGRQPPPIP